MRPGSRCFAGAAAAARNAELMKLADALKAPIVHAFGAKDVVEYDAARIEDLKEAVIQVFAHDGPALLDVVTSRQELAMPPRTELAQAEGFSMWVMKAVLNGRADEVIELARTNLGR
jgi:pyruvate dehydrogenase (quinone)